MAGEWRSLLTDPEVKGWYEEALLANRVRAGNYLRRFHMYQTERFSRSKTAITRFMMLIR